MRGYEGKGRQVNFVSRTGSHGCALHKLSLRTASESPLSASGFIARLCYLQDVYTTINGIDEMASERGGTHAPPE